MSKIRYKVKAVLDTEKASKQDASLKHALEYQNGRIYTIVDSDDTRTIDGQQVPIGNSVEMDITNMVLRKNGYSSLRFDERPFYSVEVVN